jgi:hypothetical protein
MIQTKQNPEKTLKVLGKCSDKVHFFALFCTGLQKLSLKIKYLTDFQAYRSGVGRDRTGDTRIFSPLLYRLSYRTFWEGKFREKESEVRLLPIANF